MANTFTFANLTLTDADIFGGINFLHDLNTGEEFTIGNTASASVKFVTDTQLPLYSKDATNGTFTWTQDSVSRGRYYITEVTKSSGKYEVTAYDAMILLDTNISVLSLTLPKSVSQLATAIATYIGCTVSGTVTNGSLSVSELNADLTCRELLHYVAEASGCSVKIDGSNHLCFMYYASSGITITASDYKELGLNVADYTCAKINNVTIYNTEGELQAQAGSGSNALYIGGNPLLDNATNTNATNILNKVKDFQYAPFTCEMFEENGLEVGTMATFGSTTTLVMHIESSEDGAVASAVGSDNRAEYNKDILTVVNETAAIAVNAQTIAGQAAGILADMQDAATAAGTTLEGIYADAEAAQSTLSGMQAAAAAAGTTLNGIYADAESARSSATNASEYAARALGNLGTVQSVYETLAWITAHGTMTLTTDTALDPSHVYFVVDANGDYVVGGTHYSVVTEPDVADISTYYELGIDESLNNYVATHLAVDSEGLWIIPDAGGNKVLIATGQGEGYPSAGTYIVGESGVLAAFSATEARMGSEDSSRISLGLEGVSAQKSDGTEYFEIGLSSATITQESNRSNVVATPGGQSGLYGTADLTEAPYASLYDAIETGAAIKFVITASIKYWATNPPQQYRTVTRSVTVSASSLKKGTAYTTTPSNSLLSRLAYSSSDTCYVSLNSTWIDNNYGSSYHPWSVVDIRVKLIGTLTTPAPSYAFGVDIDAAKALSFGINAGTIPSSYGLALGKYNKNDSSNNYPLIVGNGSADNSRSNALAVSWDGDIEIALNTSASSGTDHDIYAALVALGWDSDVIV